MIYALLIIFMAITSRMAGGGLGAQYLPRWLTWLPELFFAAGFGLAAYQYGGWIGAVLATAWSYIWMQTGHGVVLPWGRPIADGHFKDEMIAGRKQTLTPVVDWLAKRLGISTERPDGVYSVNYCRLFMAVKGFLIGLPAGGLPLAVLWPLGYEIGARLRGRVPFDSHILTELLAGAGAGVAIVAALYMT